MMRNIPVFKWENLEEGIMQPVAANVPAIERPWDIGDYRRSLCRVQS
jgi:hypothetical protein